MLHHTAVLLQECLLSVYASPKLCHIRRSCCLVDHEPTEVNCYRTVAVNTPADFAKNSRERRDVQHGQLNKSANTERSTGKLHSFVDTLPYVCSSERDRNFHTYATAITAILQVYLQPLAWSRLCGSGLGFGCQAKANTFLSVTGVCFIKFLHYITLENYL